MEMKMLLNSILLLSFAVGLVHSASPSQAEYVTKWRKATKKQITAFEFDGKTELTHTKDVTEPMLRQIETCFANKYTRKVIPRENYINIDGVLKAYGECAFTAAFSDNKLEFVSINGSEATFLVRKYRKFDPKLKVGEMRYFPVENFPPRPRTVMSKWIHNHGEKAIESELSETIVSEDSMSNTYTHTVGGSVTASAEFNFFVSLKTSVTAGYSHTWTDTVTKTTTKTLVLTDTVNVPGSSTVNINWVLTEQDFKMKWEAPLYMSGALGVRAKKADQLRIYFLPISEMAQFFNEIGVTGDPEPKAFIMLRGLISGKKSIGSNVRLTEFSPPTERAFGACNI